MTMTSGSIEGKQLNLCRGNIIFCHVDCFRLQEREKKEDEARSIFLLLRPRQPPQQKLFVNIVYRPLFGIGSFQIWSHRVPQGKKLSFSCSKSYSPLNFKKSHQILWFCCISNGSYKEDNLKAAFPH